MVLLEIQTHGSVEQNEEPRSRPMQYPNLYLTKVQRQLSKEKVHFSMNGAGTIRRPEAKTYIEIIYIIIYIII